MKLSSDVQAALCEQINAEFVAAYFYSALASWADAQAFSGLTGWADKASTEEREHAQMFIEYLRDRGTVTYKPIDEPLQAFGDYAGALEAALQAEELVTAKLHLLAAIARAAGDVATAHLAEGWITTEQVGAIKEIQDYLLIIKRGAPNRFDLLDREIFE